MLLLVCAGAWGQESAPKKRIAVLNFDNPIIEPNGPAGLFGADGEDVGKGVSVQLIEKLVGGGKYIVVDRSALEQMLKEQTEAEKDRLDAYAMASRIGRMVGLDAMIIGGVTRYGVDETHKDAHANGGGFGAGVRARKSKAYVEITANVFNVTTGQVMSGFKGLGESAQTGEITIIARRGKSAGALEMLGTEFVESLLPEATRNALEQVAGQLNAYAGQIPKLHIAIEGQVADVAGNTLTLNVGKKAGARIGEEVAVLREVPGSVDVPGPPGMVPLPKQIGIATITEVGEESSAAAFTGAEPAQVGDRIRALDIPKEPPQ